MKEAIKIIIENIQFTLGEQEPSDFEKEDEEVGSSADSPYDDTLVIDTHLRYIKALLERSIKAKEGDSVNIAAVQETMRYIESIHVHKPSYFFHSKSPNTLGETLPNKLVFPNFNKT